MATIKELKDRATSMSEQYMAGSITPKMVGGLFYDTLQYIDNVEQNIPEGGGGAIPEGGITSELISDGAVSEDKLEGSLKGKVESISVLSGKLNGLFWSQATFVLKAEPSFIYAGEETDVKFTATFTSTQIGDSEVEEIRITSDPQHSNVVKSAERSKTVSYTVNKTLGAGKSNALYSKVTVGSNIKTASATVSAYNKVYYGSMGTVPTADNYSALKSLVATNTAKGKTLTFTAAGDGHAFYIIVPGDVAQPTGCTNTSGVAQGFTAMGNITINEILYSVYRLGGSSYNTGVSFTFKTV